MSSQSHGFLRDGARHLNVFLKFQCFSYYPSPLMCKTSFPSTFYLISCKNDSAQCFIAVTLAVCVRMHRANARSRPLNASLSSRQDGKSQDMSQRRDVQES
jgi:hypothetical protein